MRSVSAIKSRFARLGKHIGHWPIPTRVPNTSESESTGTRSNSRNARPPDVSKLSSYKSDRVRGNVLADHGDALTDNTKSTPGTAHDKDVSEGNERLSPSELLAKVEMDLKEQGILDSKGRIPGVKRRPVSQHEYQLIQPTAPELTNVKSNPTNQVSGLPWVAEEVHFFARESPSKFPLGFINRGSFGSVFLLRHQSRGDLAALKIVKIGKGESSMLVQEVAALTRVRKHCNRFVLRQPLGVGDVIWTSDTGHLHLLFDLYLGDLHGYSGRQEVIDERLLGLVIAELHSGLSHIHRLGFIHKDLKPDNVLIDRDGHCVIADLGGCDLLPGISPTYPVSRYNAGVITPSYAAPEFYRWDENKRITYTQAVDLWSLGVTLCNLITNTIPKSPVPLSDADDKDDGYSLQAMGLEPDNIQKTLQESACPDGIIGVVIELCRIRHEKRLDLRGLDSRIREHGWDIPLGYYAPFPIDRSKSAVVLPKGPHSINFDAIKSGEDAAGAIAEFDAALTSCGLSVPKLGRFLPDHLMPKGGELQADKATNVLSPP